MNSDEIAAGLGRVVITQEESYGRTIFPDTPEFVSYMLHFQYQGEVEHEKNSQETTLLPCSIDLAPGPWLIRVVAYTRIEGVEGLADGNYPAASGSAQVNVTAGVDVLVIVNLQSDAAMTGQGVLEYEIGLAEEVIGGAVLRVLSMDKSQITSRNLLEAASGSIALNTGYYLLQIRVSTGRIRSKTELLHIYNGHTTRVTGSVWNFNTEEGNPDEIVVTNTTEWNAARAFIRGGDNNQSYTVCINGDIGVAGNTANTFDTATGITVTLIGSGKLYLTSRGRIITLAADQTLIIDSAGLTLQGLTSDQNGATQDNNTAVVYLEGSNAQLELRNGTISGNTNSSYGGGVVVGSGSFTMNGGTISGNLSTTTSQSHGGGGVYVAANATFTMNSGEISGNTKSSYDGGGVYVAGNGTFTMNGGAISSNTTSYTNSCGGGVYVASNGTFTMSNGTISGNTSRGAGGGVYVASNGTFTMSNGIISGNTSVGSYGGGVYSNGTFTMRGGEISGNTAYSGGGGVCAGSTVSIFHIVTGTVYGSDASPTTLRNTGREGAALYVGYGTNQRGTFSGETWVSAGSLSSTDNTIRVINGELQ